MPSNVSSHHRPGYVYALSNPELPGWHKVGHTHRPPYRRAAELSRTALPAVFETAYARFFWDAPAAERHAHKTLVNQGITRMPRREFFQVDLPTVQAVIGELEQTYWCHNPRDGFDPDRACMGDLADGWAASRDGLETRWEWALSDTRSPCPARRERGWRALEQMSTDGWGEASWRLSDMLLERFPGPTGYERAAWVAEAAQAQGIEGGTLRAAWLRSWLGAGHWDAWAAQAQQAWMQWCAQGSTQMIPEAVRDTLEREQRLWATDPERAMLMDDWPALNHGSKSQPQSAAIIRPHGLR